MRWVRFDAGDGPRLGRLEGGHVVPVAADRLQDVIAGASTAEAGDWGPAADVRLLAPLAPRKGLAGGQNYLGHIREQGGEAPRMPGLFAEFSTSGVRPGGGGR